MLVAGFGAVPGYYGIDVTDPNPTNWRAGQATGGPRFHKIGGAALAAELDAKRAIKEGAELAVSL